MKKTKIICSIGPASNSVEVMEQLVLNGMNCARINMSHATEEEVLKVIDTVREVRKRTGMPVAIMYDTKGPEFRTANFENEGIEIKTGETIKMVKEDVLGNKERFTVNHPEAIDQMKVGRQVLVDNALLALEIIEKGEDYVVLKALSDGEIKNHKTLNVPGVDLKLPFISEQDYKDITYAAQHSCDYLALSFVNCANDVLEARKIIEDAGGDARIISKIESQTGMDNLQEIIEASDGIMVARGDLGVEIPMEQLPIAQKTIITKCREHGKFAIVATEMLETMKDMIQNNRMTVDKDYDVNESAEKKEKRIRRMITMELDQIGISPKMIGYKYLADAIYLLIKDEERPLAVVIGETYKKSTGSVERAMQTAINKAWRVNDTEDLLKYYTARIDPRRGAPTVTEFIYYYANKVKGI